MSDFGKEVCERIEAARANPALRNAAACFMRESTRPKYSYNFFWMNRPIIQYPQDIVAMQELIWTVKPDLIVETGIAHGGSLVFSASMLALLDIADAIETGGSMNPAVSRRRVVGVDIDIRPHNRKAIEAHPMVSRIQMIEGSSTDRGIIAQVHAIAADYARVLVCLDSNHTHAHVLAELEAYAPLVSMGSYCVVFDTIIEDLPADMFPDRPWGVGNNPKKAVHEYMRRLEANARTGVDGRPLRFDNDPSVEDKLLITVAPNGFLKRVEV